VLGAFISRGLSVDAAAEADARPWPVVALAAAAIAARVPGAIRDSFWQDEVASARIIVQPTFLDMLHRVEATEATPPLWYALGWALHQLGLSPYGYRFGGLLFAALLAGTTFALARRLLEPAPAAAATLVVAFGYQFVFHGRELRAYELYALLAVLFALALLRAVERPERRRLVALAAVVAAGCLTNYFFLLFLACGALWLGVGESRTRRRPVGLALLVGLVPFLPWLPAARAQYGHDHFLFIGPFSGARAFSAYWLLVARIDPTTPVLHRLAPYGVLAAVLAAAALLVRRAGPARLVAMLAALPVLVAAAVWAAGPEVFDPRNVLGAGPFAAIAVAALPARAPLPVGVAIGTAALALLAYGYATAGAAPTTDYQAIAQRLVEEGWTPRAPIVLYHGNFFAFRGPLEWYLPGGPDLTLGIPRRSTCGAGYAVRGTRVVRLVPPVRLPRESRSTHVLTAAVGHASCVRPLTEVQLARALG